MTSRSLHPRRRDTFDLEDGQPISASAGSFFHIPKGYVPHAFQVDSETARFLSPHQASARTLHPRRWRACAVTNLRSNRPARCGEGRRCRPRVRYRVTGPAAGAVATRRQHEKGWGPPKRPPVPGLLTLFADVVEGAFSEVCVKSHLALSLFTESRATMRPTVRQEEVKRCPHRNSKCS
jgi:hypothetical protein